MTPSSRAKRNSKVPNRFSSDNSRIETSNTNGETIIDYNDKSTSTTHTLAPMNRAIKFNPVLREPLKVKLPKLKRPHMQSTKGTSLKNNTSEIKIHKIKLPSRKAKSTGFEIDPKSGTKAVSNGAQTKPKLERFHVEDSHASTAEMAASPSYNRNSTTTKGSAQSIFIATAKSPTTSDRLSTSVSKFSDGEKTTSADTSLSSEEATSRMKIVVSPSDSADGSGIHCPCDVDCDLGVMVECESCSTWQHGHCINVGTEEEAYEGYICAYCTMPRDKVHQSLLQLTVGDKFQSRFDYLKSLLRQGDAPSHIQFNLEELSQAIKDLKRVLNSLKVKYRLLISEEYELELRIWQNPHWSEEPNSDVEKHFYFMDRCKSNLKLNIRNMVKKMEERCQLIDHAIKISNLDDKNIGNDGAIHQAIRSSLEEVAQGVREIKNKFISLSI